MIDESKFVDTDSERIYLSRGNNYGINILEDGKSVACAYIKPFPTYYKLYKVLVPEERRRQGLGTKIMNLVLKIFNDKDIELRAYPNKISDLEERKSYYKQLLIDYYKRFGFEQKNNSTVMFKSCERTYTETEDLFE